MQLEKTGHQKVKSKIKEGYSEEVVILRKRIRDLRNNYDNDNDDDDGNNDGNDNNKLQHRGFSFNNEQLQYGFNEVDSGTVVEYLVNTTF
eukprot:Pgem_evm1s15755